MLTLLDNAGPYALPTGWHEVTTRQYCDLDRLQLATVEARAGYFAGRSIQVNELVADALAWMLHPVPLDTGLPYPADLGQETFLQVESIRKLLSEQPLCDCFAAVYGTFVARERSIRPLHRIHYSQPTGEFFGGHGMTLPIFLTLPAVAHCLAELQRLAEAFSVLSEPDHTEAARRAREAGSERLAPFGHLNVARAYAERFGKTIEEVYQWPWQQVAMFLVQDRISAEIQDNLSKQKADE